MLTKHRLGTNLVGFNNAPGKGCRRLSFFLPFRHHGEDLVENLDIEQAQEDPGQNLKAIVSEIAGGGLQKQSFLRLSHEAYSEANGPDNVRGLVSDWESVAGTISSGSDSAALLGYLQFILGDLDDAQKTLESDSGSEWASYWLCRILLAKEKADEVLALAKMHQNGSPAAVDFSYLSVEAHLLNGSLDEANSILESIRSGEGETCLLYTSPSPRDS